MRVFNREDPNVHRSLRLPVPTEDVRTEDEMQLHIGTGVEVFSRSRSAWTTGRVTAVDGHAVVVQYDGRGRVYDVRDASFKRSLRLPGRGDAKEPAETLAPQKQKQKSSLLSASIRIAQQNLAAQHESFKTLKTPPIVAADTAEAVGAPSQRSVDGALGLWLQDHAKHTSVPPLLQVSDLPCDIRREGGQSLVIGGPSLVN